MLSLIAGTQIIRNVVITRHNCITIISSLHSYFKKFQLTYLTVGILSNFAQIEWHEITQSNTCSSATF